ncbi:MAG: ferrous iron transport protein A [Deferribacterales bacterium]|nr:ferrous iron transport protein A [Deferribacterales bacterium]
MKLSEAPVQKECTVTSLCKTDEGVFCRLLAMGILPGAKMKLIKKEPHHLCEIHGCKLAIDCSLAEKIHVK